MLDEKNEGKLSVLQQPSVFCIAKEKILSTPTTSTAHATSCLTNIYQCLLRLTPYSHAHASAIENKKFTSISPHLSPSTHSRLEGSQPADLCPDTSSILSHTSPATTIYGSPYNENSNAVGPENIVWVTHSASLNPLHYLRDSSQHLCLTSAFLISQLLLAKTLLILLAIHGARS